MHAAAAGIREYAAAPPTFPSALDEEEYAAAEGELLLRQHRLRERDRTLVSKKKEQALRRDRVLQCEGCGFVFSLEEIRRFLDEVQGDRWEALYILAFGTGMREGELLGLRWQDVEFPNRTLTVNVAVTETDDDRFVLAEPKTIYSRRTIALPEQATQALLDHWKRQIAESERMGSQWHNDHNLVFPNGFGGIMIPHNIAKRSFKRHLVAAGIPREARIHDIRHTHATQLLILGVNVKVVSERLGHADVATTMRTYAHVLPHMQQTAVDGSATLIGSYEPRKVDTQIALLG